MAGACQLLPIKSCTTESVYPTHSARFCWVQELKKKRQITYFVPYLESVLLVFGGDRIQNQQDRIRRKQWKTDRPQHPVLGHEFCLWFMVSGWRQAGEETGSSSRGGVGGTALGRDGGKGERKREIRTFARSRGARVQFIYKYFANYNLSCWISIIIYLWSLKKD